VKAGGVSTRRAVWATLGKPWVARLLSLTLVLATGTVIAIALWLEPADQGHGTHRQLGLNGCSFLTASGYPCPMCGATTTFTLWAHLDPIRGIVNQPFASLLFLMTLGTLGLSLVELVDPRDRWRRLLSTLAPYEGRLATAFLAIMGLSWIYKIWLMA
jgi:hypothetical protein